MWVSLRVVLLIFLFMLIILVATLVNLHHKPARDGVVAGGREARYSKSIIRVSSMDMLHIQQGLKNYVFLTRPVDSCKICFVAPDDARQEALVQKIYTYDDIGQCLYDVDYKSIYPAANTLMEAQTLFTAEPVARNKGGIHVARIRLV